MFPKSGKYVVAVSGGMDSMSLLHMLVRRDGYELIVAHAHHGLREDADGDQELVEQTAGQYALPYRTTQLQLNDSGEDAARRARYDFLYSIYEKEEADGIVTAHHLDDRIETMYLNQQRGAGWFGLSPLRETGTTKRPLLEMTKQELHAYAQEYDIQWREDATNQEPEYTPRNRLRLTLAENTRKQLYEQIKQYDIQRATREKYTHTIGAKTVTVFESGVSIDRRRLLVYDVATIRDVLYLVLKEYFQDYMEIDFDAVIRLEHFYKTGRNGKQLSLSKHVWAYLETDAMVISVAR